MYGTNGGDPPTVMVVEDDVDLANLFALWLGRTYRVRVAHDCPTAYDLLDEATDETTDDTIDVALLDRHLPGGSGDEVLAAIRDRDLDCRVAMVTGVEPGIEIIEMGFDDYLCKPVTEEELYDTVEGLIAQAEYGEAIEEFYVLASKKSLLETHCSPAELATDEEYAALEARYEELDFDLSSMLNAFTDTQFTSEYARIGRQTTEHARLGMADD